MIRTSVATAFGTSCNCLIQIEGRTLLSVTELRGLRPSPSVTTTDTPDGVVLFDFKEGMSFPLDPVASLIWKGIQQGLQAGEIAAEIASTFQTSVQQVSQDVLEFVTELQKSKLLLGEAPVEVANRRFVWLRELELWKHVRRPKHRRVRNE